MASLKAKEIFCLIYAGLLFISGLVLIGFSPYLLFKIFYYYAFIPSGTVGPFFVIFFLGILHLFLTWLAVKGPTREHNFHLVMFMVFALILLACEFAVGVWSVILWDEVEIGSIDLMTKSFTELKTLQKHEKDWHKIEAKFQCCGLNGVIDYNINGTTCPFLDGCKLPMIRFTKGILMDGVIIGFICAIFQGLGIFIFCSYFKKLRKERTERVATGARAQRERQVTGGDVPMQVQTYVPVNSPPPPSTPPASAPPPTVPSGSAEKAPETPPVSAPS